MYHPSDLAAMDPLVLMKNLDHVRMTSRRLSYILQQQVHLYAPEANELRERIDQYVEAERQIEGEMSRRRIRAGSGNGLSAVYPTAATLARDGGTGFDFARSAATASLTNVASRPISESPKHTPCSASSSGPQPRKSPRPATAHISS